MSTKSLLMRRRYRQIEIDVLVVAPDRGIDRVLGFGVEPRVPIVEDLRDLDQALRHVGLLAAAERDDRELAQERLAVAVRTARDVQRKTDENHPARFVCTHHPQFTSRSARNAPERTENDPRLKVRGPFV